MGLGGSGPHLTTGCCDSLGINLYQEESGNEVAMATTGTKALQGRLYFPNPRADSPEQEPDRQGWGWGREGGGYTERRTLAEELEKGAKR